MLIARILPPASPFIKAKVAGSPADALARVHSKTSWFLSPLLLKRGVAGWFDFSRAV
jgi:hypothetical protein